MHFVYKVVAHEIEGSVEIQGDVATVTGFNCSCKAGLSQDCKLVAAVLLHCTRLYCVLNYLHAYQAQALLFLFFFCCCFSFADQISWTSNFFFVQCYWKKEKVNILKVYEPAPITQTSNIFKTASEWCDKSNKCILDVPPSHGKRIIILHAGSENGWVGDALFLSAINMKQAIVDYHENMTADIHIWKLVKKTNF